MIFEDAAIFKLAGLRATLKTLCTSESVGPNRLRC